MQIQDILNIAVTILGALGGGAAIVLAASGWLGKLWAARILESERAKHGQELEGIKAKYLQEIEAMRAKFGFDLEGIRANYSQQLEALKTTFLLDVERRKTSLKKSEFIFQKEFEAASAMVALIRSIRPTLVHPDMDWYEACDEIARSFDRHERVLEAYLTAHGAVLEESVRDKVGTCIAIASGGKFLDDPVEVPTSLNKDANRFYEELVAVESALLTVVRSQATH
jgi:hypothetical protein